MNLTELLCFLNDHIDPAHVQNVEGLHVDAMNFQPVERLPLSIDFPVDPRVKPFPYCEAFDDPAKMLYNELAGIGCNVLNHVTLGDDYPLQIRANYGIGVISSLFGQDCRIVADNMPWVDHLHSMDAAKRILDRGVPDPDSGLGRKVRVTLEYFRAQFEKFPVLASCVRLTQPDLQGPFDILHLMLGNDVFLALYDEPCLMHDLLALISETYIRYRRFIDPYLTDKADGAKKCYVHHALYGGGVVLKDDTAAATISEEMYQEYALPYNARIYEAMGGGSLHYCGARKPWHYRMMLRQPLSCLNFGNPDQHDFIKEHNPLTQARICVVGFGEGMPYSFLRSHLEAGFRTGLTLYCSAASLSEARAIMAEHAELFAR